MKNSQALLFPRNVERHSTRNYSCLPPYPLNRESTTFNASAKAEFFFLEKNPREIRENIPAKLKLITPVGHRPVIAPFNDSVCSVHRRAEIFNYPDRFHAAGPQKLARPRLPLWPTKGCTPVTSIHSCFPTLFLPFFGEGERRKNVFHENWDNFK